MLRVAPVALLDHESWRPWSPSAPPSDRQYTAQLPVVIVNRRSRSKHRSDWRESGWREVRNLKIVPLHDPPPRPGCPRLPGPLQRLPAGILPPTAPEAHQTFIVPSRVLHSEGLSYTAEALGPRSCSKPWWVAKKNGRECGRCDPPQKQHDEESRTIPASAGLWQDGRWRCPGDDTKC